MASPKPITIVGGGLAGLTLGIGLRRHGVPVTLWEAAHYPRHRVCGEFISGRGLGTLARLELRQLISRAGATPALTAAFFSRQTASRVQTLPSPALCISRFILDGALAGEFSRLGGDLKAGERWRETFSREGVVRATGRHAQATDNGWRWFGLKAHARGVSLTADLEMHVAPNGYVGLCKLANGDVNACGLFRRRSGVEAGGHGRELLRGEKGSLLRERLAGAVLEEGTFCSVAGLTLKPQRAVAHTECCVGEAITMIPPITGNGMSMAFESAEIAIEPIEDWSPRPDFLDAGAANHRLSLRRGFQSAIGVGRKVAGAGVNVAVPRAARVAGFAEQMVLATLVRVDPVIRGCDGQPAILPVATNNESCYAVDAGKPA